MAKYSEPILGVPQSVAEKLHDLLEQLEREGRWNGNPPEREQFQFFALRLRELIDAGYAAERELASKVPIELVRNVVRKEGWDLAMLRRAIAEGPATKVFSPEFIEKLKVIEREMAAELV